MRPLRSVASLSLAALCATTALTVAAGPARAEHWTKKTRITSPAATFAKARGVTGVWMYGDSITVAHAPALAAALRGRGRVLAYDANSGIPTAPAVDRLAARIKAQGPPTRLVIALGSNDTNSPAAMRSQVERVMAMVPSSTRVYWVNVWKKQTKKGAAQAAKDWKGTAAINAAIATVDKRHANLSTVDWFRQVQSDKTHPAQYFYDGLHTLPPGRDARNALVLRAVAPHPMRAVNRAARAQPTLRPARLFRLPWRGLPAPCLATSVPAVPSYFYRSMPA